MRPNERETNLTVRLVKRMDKSANLGAFQGGNEPGGSNGDHSSNSGRARRTGLLAQMRNRKRGEQRARALTLHEEQQMLLDPKQRTDEHQANQQSDAMAQRRLERDQPATTAAYKSQAAGGRAPALQLKSPAYAAKSARDVLSSQVHLYNNELVGLVVLPSLGLAGEKRLDRGQQTFQFLRMSLAKSKRQNAVEEDQRQQPSGGLDGGPRKQSAEEIRALYEESFGDIEDSLNLMKLQKKGR